MRDRLRASLVLAVLALGVAVAPAQAAPESLREVAKHRFEDGKHAFDAHDYATALRLFKESYALAPYPALLFNIARCQEELGMLSEAIDDYDRYLAMQPETDLRQKVEALRARLAAQPEPNASVPPVAVPAPTPAPVVVTDVAPPVLMAPVVVAARPIPVYRRWWPWTIGAVVVVGVGLGLGLGLGLHGADVHRFPPLSTGTP